MLEWLLNQREQVAKRLKAVQIEGYRLEGGLAALEAAMEQERKGGSNAAAPAPAPAREWKPGDSPVLPAMPATAYSQVPIPPPDVSGIGKAVKVARGEVQAEEELRE